MSTNVKRTAFLLIIVALLFSAVTEVLSSPTEDTWATKAPMQNARSGLGAAVLNGKIYAIGGVINYRISGINEEYNPIFNGWALKAPMPTPRYNFAIASYQNKIYCIGGTISVSSHGEITATDANEVYDPGTNTWETKTSMPTARSNLQANVVNGQIFLIGGIRRDPPDNVTTPHRTNFGHQVSNVVEVYDPAKDTWTTKTPMPATVEGYVSAAVNNKIYLINSERTQIFDAMNDSWSLGGSPPPFGPIWSGGATTGKFAPQRIYVFTADNNQEYNSQLSPESNILDQIKAQQQANAWLSNPGFTARSYDPRTNNWTISTFMPTARYATAVAVLDDKLYVIGGDTITPGTMAPLFQPTYTTSAANEQYTPIGYGTPDPDYQLPLPQKSPSPSPSVSPSRLQTPNTAPFHAPSPSASPTPSASPQPTQLDSAASKAELPERYAAATAVGAVVVAVTAVCMLKKTATRSKKAPSTK